MTKSHDRVGIDSGVWQPNLNGDFPDVRIAAGQCVRAGVENVSFHGKKIKLDDLWIKFNLGMWGLLSIRSAYRECVMIKIAIAAAAVVAFTWTLAVPTQATVLVPGSTGQPTQAFPPGTQGTVVASQSVTSQALTFAATFNQAVYRTAGGTLDFYYQVARTGAGTAANEEIRSFTVSNFGGFMVDAFVIGADTDGAGPFLMVNNPALANGTPSGSTTTFGRSPSGNVLTTEFGANGLTGTENSTTYVFRTNATAFNDQGFFGIIDGSTLSGRTYMPTAAVPEPGTWAMMLVGFGAMGVSMRRRSNANKRVAHAA